MPASASIRRAWGFHAFAALSLLALAKLLAQPLPGHYRVFTGAGRAIWEGRNPYGDAFDTGVGYYFYSPSCALTVFGPLSLLPEKLGIVLYMAFSWLVFVWGARAFGRAFLASRLRGGPFPALQGFWLAIAGPMFGAILASKLEILIVGILLGGLAWLLEGRKLALSAILLAMVLNWKLQPLPVLGLAALAWLLARGIGRGWRWPSGLAAATAGWYALPFALKPWGYLRGIHATWSSTFATFVRKAWPDFENLFAFLQNSFGLRLTYEATQLISGAAGLAFAAATTAGVLRARAGDRLPTGILLAAALGSTFAVVFSPLGQNNAMILSTPLWLAGFLSLELSHGRARGRWALALAAFWLVMALGYSDLIPHAWSAELRALIVKPAACLVFGAGLAAAWVAKPPYRPNLSS